MLEEKDVKLYGRDGFLYIHPDWSLLNSSFTLWKVSNFFCDMRTSSGVAILLAKILHIEQLEIGALLVEKA